MLSRLLHGALAVLALAGCAGVPSHAERFAHAQALATSGHLQLGSVSAGTFVLTSYWRVSRTDRPLTVYIEGDGFAWRTRTQPSDDPTPIAATGLAMAAADPGPNVLYLARPCQYTAVVSSPGCDVAYWTQKRFAEEVVVALNDAISQYAAALPGQSLDMVGYSGGGALAALIAARRDDVRSLRTVAGNLDQVEVNRMHKVTPMPESLSAIDVAGQLAAIPQLHISGADDRVVAAVIAERFVRAVASPCAKRLTVAGMGHNSDWARQWPALLTVPLTCTVATPAL